MSVHAFSTTIMNVSNDSLAVGEATATLQQELQSDIDFVDIDTTSGTGEIKIQYQARLTEEQVSQLQDSDLFEYYGSL